MAAGRPTDFTQEAADLICEEIAKGRTLAAVCADEGAEFDGLPSERTVYRWLQANPDFCQQYAHAHERQADREFEEAREIAAAATPENVQVARLQIDTIKWRVAKRAPRKYGDKVTTEHTGPDGGPIQYAVMSREERAARIRELEDKRRAADRG